MLMEPEDLPDLMESIEIMAKKIPKKPPVFVKLAKGDTGVGLLSMFYEHPDSYTKYIADDGKIDMWGFYPYSVDEGEFEGWLDIPGVELMQRRMYVQSLYFDVKRPEDQFVEYIIRKKVEQLKTVELADLAKSDYVLKIRLSKILNSNGEDRIWRRFRVSGALCLSVLADKVIKPLVGWTRNLHAHIFTDFSDGAIFGPKGCRCVDMMHLDMAGFAFIPEGNYCVAHLLRKVGDSIGLCYDFGDRWFHEIIVEEIIDPEESTGAVAILGGSGMCPPENSQGNPNWIRMIHTLENGGMREQRKLLDQIFGEVNYIERGWKRSEFDIDRFDIEDARSAVMNALNSNGSIAGRAYTMPLGDSSVKTLAEMTARRGQTVTRTYDTASVAPDGGYWEETVSTKRDNIRKTACAGCGSPHDLKVCTQCRQRYYCSKTCQKTHWKELHRFECESLKK